MLYFCRNIPVINTLKFYAKSLKKNLFILKTNAISLKKNLFFTFHYSTCSPPSGIKQPELHLNNLKYSCSTSQKTQCVNITKSLRKKVYFLEGKNCKNTIYE